MLDKFLALLERFVVAHELIAANSARTVTVTQVGELSETVAKTDAAAKPRGRAGKAQAKEEADDDEEKAPAKTTRTRKTAEPAAKTGRAGGKAKGPDLRAEIGEMAKKAVEGDDLDDDDADDLVDKFDDLLEEFEVKNVKELDDDQVADFHKELKAIIEEYYDAE